MSIRIIIGVTNKIPNEMSKQQPKSSLKWNSNKEEAIITVWLWEKERDWLSGRQTSVSTLHYDWPGIHSVSAVSLSLWQFGFVAPSRVFVYFTFVCLDDDFAILSLHMLTPNRAGVTLDLLMYFIFVDITILSTICRLRRNIHEKYLESVIYQIWHPKNVPIRMNQLKQKQKCYQWANV